MTPKKEKLPRDPHDRYYTPMLLAQAITKRLAQLLPPIKTVLEPSAGTGVFCKAVQMQWPDARISAIEPYPTGTTPLSHLSHALNFCTFEQWNLTAAPAGGFDLVIGNPPFTHAEAHVKKAREVGQHVAFLLRMSFMATQERVERMWTPPSGLKYLIPIVERASFNQPGAEGRTATDNSEYAVYVWERGYNRPHAVLLPHLWWRTPEKM